MTDRIKAIFERGVFRPVDPVALEDGASVELSYERPKELKPPQPLVAAIEEIARMPLESQEDGFSGADHDQVLYGKRGAW
jgi:predicted DNA-binding antitoxin AbrB/MazE fold protein